MKRSSERGFSLLEVLVATALTIGVILGATGAVVGGLHASSLADRHMALNDDALSALADVRAISAYDPVMFAKLAGRSASMTRTGSSGTPETISVAIASPSKAKPPATLQATVTVAEGDVSVSQVQTLYLEAPAPGSNVNAQ